MISDGRRLDPQPHPFGEYVNPHLADLLQRLRMDKRFVRGEGPWLWDSDGARYLDFIANYGAVPFGYNPTAIWEALAAVRQRAEPSFVQPSMLDAAGELARRLVELAPPGLTRVTFTNSGAEAVEAAIKLCRAATGRRRILAAHNSFHGKTLGALSATGRPAYQGPFGAPIEGFDFVPYGDAEALQAALERHPREYAALLLEPIQGEGGIVVPPPGYLRAARELTARHGVLLVLDEIQTGLGRTGHLFACQAEGVNPDVLTLAKALGGGLLPIGACLCTEAAYTEEFALKHSSTFAGGALACRAGLAALELLTRDGGALLEHVRRRGEQLLAGLRRLAERFPHVIREVRGRGLMIGVEFQVEPGTFRRAAQGRRAPAGEETDGALAGTLLEVLSEQELLTPLISSYLLNVEGLRVAPTLNGQSVIRIEPPLTIGEAECARALDSLERVTALLAAGETGALLRHLVEEPCRPHPVSGALQAQHDGAGAGRGRAGAGRGGAGAGDVAEPTADEGPVARPGDGRFAFLVHPLDLDNYHEFDPALKALSAEGLGRLAERFNSLLSPFVIGRTRVISAAGRAAYGEFVVVPRTTRQLLDEPRSETLPLIREAVQLAKDRGALIVGLGAYTSIVSRGGVLLSDIGVALTTGNSYTVAAAIEALAEAARRLGVAVASARAAVVGAGGSIGRATALLLGPQVQRLVLVGNPASGRRALERLERVAQEVRESCAGSRGTAASRSPAAQARPPQQAQRPCPELSVTLDVAAALREAELVVIATNSAEEFITPEMLAPGAVVCDLSRPPNVSRRVDGERPDVLVVDGGVIEVPGRPDFGWNFGYEPGLAYACMAETMMLALEQHYEPTSLGSDLRPEVIAWMQALAARHGFRLAELRSFDRPLSPQRWERLVAARAALAAAR